MKLRTLRALGATAATVAVLAGTATQVAAAEPVTANAFASPTAYADYLEHSKEEGSRATLAAFQALSPDKQSQFLHYLQDPSLYKDFLTASTDEPSNVTALTTNINRTVPLRNGDITFESESVVSAPSAAAGGALPVGNHEVKRRNTIRVLGIPALSLSIWVQFHSNGSDITEVIDADGASQRVGLVIVSKEKAKKSRGTQQFCRRGASCVGGHTAIASIIWNVSSTTFAFDKKQTLTVSRNGTGTASLKNV
ncbi:hypothetical protein OG802_17865 [Streptomyces sp. NBC_00704]|uniref:hypothetical protein n=1 Tax=Streptomyces sp. NBC_00704 TaxID=2975809 RepID=UPI002E3404DC|nr:hypothetical protein [Streptomyces sp. NBC_00704]